MCCEGGPPVARLVGMGFVPGVEIRVRPGDCAGAFVVSLRGSTVVVGRDLAERLLVEECPAKDVCRGPARFRRRRRWLRGMNRCGENKESKQSKT
jgi:Fe2+ transport system protein FeoA